MTAQETSKALETVHGSGCYKFGDEETPAKARRAAMAIAQEQAVRSHHVFVESSVRVKNFQLEEDLIQTASAAMLQDIHVDKEDRTAQEICMTLTAKISPVSMEDMIRQRVNAKEIAQAAELPVGIQSAGFGLRVWTNKQDGHYVEGDRLIIYLQPERDAYLKLDYFQADGTVVHLVPNLFRGQAFVKGGKTYAFGDDASPERFIVQSPYGAETIKAVLSVRPFEGMLDGKDTSEDSRTYLKNLQSGLRGIKVQAVEQAASLTTTSKAVDKYRGERPSSSPQKGN
jgi:muconolactone delta-isomerase